MNLGAMRHLIHFYKPKQIANKLGDVKTCYFYAFSSWASKTELSSDESIENAKQIAIIKTLFKTRFCPINTSFIMLFNGNDLNAPKKLKIALLKSGDEVYEIISVIDKMGLKKELEITAQIKEKRS